MITKKIIGHYRQVVVEISPFVFNGPPKDPDTVLMMFSGENPWYISIDAEEIIQKEHKFVIQNFPKNDWYDIWYAIEYFIRQVKFSKIKLTDKIIETRLQQVTNEVVERDFCIAVKGIKTTIPFALGDVLFQVNTPEIKQAIKGSMMLNQASDETTWACTTLLGSNTFVYNAASYVIDVHLDALTFLYQVIIDRYQSGKSPLLEKTNSNVNKLILAKLKTSPTYGTSTNLIHHQILEFDQVVWDEIIKDSLFKKIVETLKDDGDISQRIIIALSFYHEAALEKHSDIKIFKCVCGIESLLRNDSDSSDGKIQSNLSEKVAFLLEDKLADRIKLKNVVIKFYELRSQVGHGKSRVDDDITALDAHFLLGRVLIKFLYKAFENDGFNTDRDIEKWFVESKLS